MDDANSGLTPPSVFIVRLGVNMADFKSVYTAWSNSGKVDNFRSKFAVLDLRLQDGSGLDVVPVIREADPNSRIVILTGYGNIATAVAAVKAGAVDYLAKPADADQVIAALLTQGADLPPPPENPMSADRVRWEHIQRVYEQCDRNVSETARRLKMHRRTLQRILSKRAPRETNDSP